MQVMFFFSWIDVQVRVGPFLTSFSLTGWQMATGGGDLGGMAFPIMFVFQALPFLLHIVGNVKNEKGEQTPGVAWLVVILHVANFVAMLIFRLGFEGFATSQLQANIDGFQYIRSLVFRGPFTTALIISACLAGVNIILRVIMTLNKSNMPR